ncbi:ferrochelatase [Latilactobacillus sakei]|uniref:TMEM175 family protein n=2 Tax=Latilactobacillus sakei TaxID=1599 RepID=A0A9N7PAX2_LATSK|nr:TMEM175 family protein [Latilactobacillus sakei]AST84374.1 DUF1211 domain-containing protein [Latilactobacillus sakei]AWZ42322.1 DUF1211 domain-containing protein [Latilactobacillus sakei]AWZ46508.1 DUF1211 domain-containing protein [Latilactobacillus sakei]AYG15704.1 DUF1211 domain-containing protein [Latilactobacillus sakei]AYG26216.1 DUF1211 domain-containing protein [Latilactobacillus sakei]
MKKERFEAFTDAVIAIILTILVLELHLPEDDHSWMAILDVRMKFFAYVLTFIFIATMWVNHHYLFAQVKQINGQIIWVNILLLFWTSLLPATTAWLGTDIHSVAASTLYNVNVLLFNITTAYLRRLVIKTNPIHDMHMLLIGELVSFSLNFITLIVSFFYPPFPFIGLSLNIMIWAVVGLRGRITV